MSEANGGSKPQVTIVSSTQWAKSLEADFQAAGYPVTYLSESKVDQTEDGVLLVPDSIVNSLSESLLHRVTLFHIVPKDVGDALSAIKDRNHIREETTTRDVLETVEKVVFGDRGHTRFFLRSSARLKSPDRSYRGHTVDISLGGAAVMISARTKPVEGELLTVELDFGHGGPTLHCTGTVQWIRNHKGVFFKKIVIGLKFDMTDRENEVSEFITECQKFAVQISARNMGGYDTW